MSHAWARSAAALVVIAGFVCRRLRWRGTAGDLRLDDEGGNAREHQGGFSLKYPATYVKIEPTPDPASDPGLIYQVYLADPTGARSGSRALDVLGVAVRRLSRTARPGDLRKHRSEFEAIAAQLIGKPAALRMVEPFSLTTLGGHAALKAAYVFTVDGVDVAAVAYLVPVGNAPTGSPVRPAGTPGTRRVAPSERPSRPFP